MSHVTHIEAFFPVDPGDLRINAAYKCRCLGHRGQVYASQRHKAAKRLVEVTASRTWSEVPVPEFPDGPVRVEYWIRPRTVHRTGEAAGLPRLDVDAPCKALLDALNGIAYGDDSQVVEVIGRKTTQGPVGIRVRISRM